MQAFTKNYHDNSTEEGFSFTFHCDNCGDGYKTKFIESSTYKSGKGIKLLSQGLSLLGNFVGGSARSVASNIERGGNILSNRFDGKSPDWRREHEKAFVRAQNEAQESFRRCPSCNKYVCSVCFNDDEGLCVACAPRENVYIAKTKADAMKRNIDSAGESAQVWQGKIESKTVVCPSCGKPSGKGKFCNNCGESLEQPECKKCGAKNSVGVRFCSNCGESMIKDKAGKCPDCGADAPPGTKFCGGCGKQIE